MGIPGVRHPVMGELKKGDWVFIVSRFGPRPDQLKRRRARVMDVLKHAAILHHIEDENSTRQTKTISFNELEYILPEQQPEGSPSRRAWEAVRDAPPPPPGPAPVPQEPIDPPSLTARPFQALLGTSGKASADVSVAAVMEKVNAAAVQPRPKQLPPIRLTAKADAPRPNAPPPAPTNGHGADITSWASSGRAILEKQVADFDDRIKMTLSEIEERHMLLKALNEQSQNARDMLAFLDKMPKGGRT